MDPQVVSLPLPVRSLPLRSLRRHHAQPDSPRLSVVVVNYHHWRDTAALVRQLRRLALPAHAAPPRSSSSTTTRPCTRSPPAAPRTPGVSLRRWRRNRGFARAVNEGCRLSRGDWVLLLNPDVTLAPGFLDARRSPWPTTGRRRARASASSASACATPTARRQLSAGPFPTLAGTLARLLLPRAAASTTCHAPTSPRRVDWATGCCLLVRRDCLLGQLGGFDPRFLPLLRGRGPVPPGPRARLDRLVYEPAPVGHHHHPLHGRAVPPHLRLITRHALLTYARKHWPRWQFRLPGGIVRVRSGAARLVAHRAAATPTVADFRANWACWQRPRRRPAADGPAAAAPRRPPAGGTPCGPVSVHRHSQP